MNLLDPKLKLYISIFLGVLTFGVVADLVRLSLRKSPEETAKEACEMMGYSLALNGIDTGNESRTSVSVNVNGVSYPCK